MSLYDVLGVKVGAHAAELRAAYRRLAKRCHPDAGGDVNEFQRVAKAYDVLSDPVKRLAYDATGQEDEGPAPEDAAVGILRNLIEMVIADQRDPARIDFVAEMRRRLDEGIANARVQTADIGRRIARCRTLARRITAKSGNNLMRRMVEGRIVDMDKQIAAIARERENIEAALTLLASYDYEVDAVPQDAMRAAAMNAYISAQQAQQFQGIGGIF